MAGAEHALDWDVTARSPFLIKLTGCDILTTESVVGRLCRTFPSAFDSPLSRCVSPPGWREPRVDTALSLQGCEASPR